MSSAGIYTIFDRTPEQLRALQLNAGLGTLLERVLTVSSIFAQNGFMVGEKADKL